MAVGSNLAGVARVSFEADTGRFNTDLAQAEQRYRQTTGAMSDDALRMSSAQDRLNRAISRYGPQSRQAADATLRLRSAQRQAHSEASAATASIEREERSLGRLSRGAIAGSGALHGLGRSVAFASAGFLGGAGLSYAIRSTLTAAEEAQRVLGQTRNAVERSGLSWSTYGRQVREAALQLSNVSGFDDERLLGTFSTFVRRTKDVNRALELNAVAADVARGRNISLEAAQQLVLKASIGQAGALRRVGINAKLGSTGLQLVDMLSRTYAGSAEKYGQTAAGAQDRFRVAVQNLQEAIGAGLIPTITRILDPLSTWLNTSRNQERVQRDVSVAVHETSVAVGGLATVVRGVDDITGSFKNTLELLAAAFVGLKLAKWARELGLLKLATAEAAGANAGLAASEAAVTESAVVSRIAAYTGGVTALGAEATAATAEVSALSAALSSVAAFAVAPIVITLIVDEIIHGKHGLTSRAITAGANAVIDAAGINRSGSGAPTYQQWSRAKGSERAAIEDAMRSYGITDPRQLPGGPLEGTNNADTATNERNPRPLPKTATTTAKGGARHSAKDPGTGIPYLDLLLAQAEGTTTRSDDERVVQQVIATLRRRLARAKTLKSRTELTQAVTRYQNQLASLRDQDAQAVSEASSKAQEKAAKDQQAAADRRAKSLQIPDTLTEQLAKAELTKGEADDIRVLRQERGFLQRQLHRHKLTLSERRDLYQQLGQVNDQIASLRTQQRQKRDDARKAREERQDLLLERSEARAALTPGIADDLRVLDTEERIVRRRLARLARIKHLNNDELRAQIDLLNQRKEIRDKRKELRNEQQSDAKDLLRQFLSADRGLYGGASNVFTQDANGFRAPGSSPTSVIVNQHFNAPPTTDGRREAILAKHAAMAAYD